MFLMLLRRILLASLLAAAPALAEVSVTDARVRALLPGADKTVGYFEITNSGTTAISLVGARSAAARAIELHTTIDENGMLRMRRLEREAVPAGATVRFEPGGRHLMIFGIETLGEDLEIELLRATGAPVRVHFARIPIGAR